MRKNKKIVALICALSMVVSMFAGLTIVSAADKGVTLAATKDSDTQYTVKASYTGFENGISGANLLITIPDGATVEADTSLKGAMPVVGAAPAGQYQYIIGLADNTKTDDGVFATFVIKTAAALTEDFKVALAEGSTVDELDENYDSVVISVADGTLAAETTLPAGGSTPVATDKPSDPTAAPADKVLDKPTVDDTVAAPEIKTDKEVTKGITLDAEKVSDTEYNVKASYTGFDNGISGANLIVTVPDGATVEGSTALKGAMPVVGSAPEGQYQYIIGLADNTKADDGVFATLNIKLANPLESDFYVEIQQTSNIDELDADYNSVTVKGEDLVMDIATLEATINSDVELGELVDADKADDNSYVGYEAKKGDDDAVYGTDYVAYYDGVKLTEAQLKNYLAGQYGKVGDVIDHISFERLNGDVDVTAQIVTDGEVKDEGSTAEPTPTTKPTTKPSNTLTVTSTVAGKTASSVTKGSIITVTANVPDSIKVEGGKVTYTMNNSKLEEVSGADGEWKFLGNDTGKTTITVNYVDADGKVIATAKKEITIKTEGGSTDNKGGSSSSSSSSTSSGSGVIANGIGGVVDGGGVYNGGATGFTDLGSVPWAAAAINNLAAQNVVTGYGDGTFGPNNNITRAEYAQILVNVLNRGGDSADTYFDDVPTDAWFYHSVAVAAQLGIIEGYGDGNFGPNDLITREQMALMTQKAAAVAGKNLTAIQSIDFTDAAEIADWASDAVYTLAGAGIINGMDDGSFAPKANATRAQAAVIVNAAFN